jgi:hemoglobin-like flavoprotein
MKSYELRLPVFKQGDDLNHQIGAHPQDLSAALVSQAENYTEAARLCQRLAAVVKKRPELQIDACTHHIGVDGPTDLLEALVEEGVLESEEIEDE